MFIHAVRHVRSILVSSLIAVAAMAQQVPASAQTPVLSLSSDGGVLSGYDGTLGWEFTVNSTVNLTAFGFFNDGGAISTSHQVGLWDTSGNLLTSGTVGPSASDTTIGLFDYSTTAPYTLQAGTTYVIGALLSSSDAYYVDPSSIGPDPSISWVQGQYDTNGAAALTFPQTALDPAFGEGYAFFGPSFEVASLAPPGVPEPTSLIAVPVGMVMLGW